MKIYANSEQKTNIMFFFSELHTLIFAIKEHTIKPYQGGEEMLRLKERRKELGMTQGQLALKAGLAKGYVSDLETGRRNNPSLVTMKKIAKALKCKIGDIF